MHTQGSETESVFAVETLSLLRKPSPLRVIKSMDEVASCLSGLAAVKQHIETPTKSISKVFGGVIVAIAVVNIYKYLH